MNYDSKSPTTDQASNGPGSGDPQVLHTLVDAHSVRARAAERAQLRADLDAFLAQGGAVTTLEANRRVDLPKPPQNNYGKGSL